MLLSDTENRDIFSASNAGGFTDASICRNFLLSCIREGKYSQNEQEDFLVRNVCLVRTACERNAGVFSASLVLRTSVFSGSNRRYSRVDASCENATQRGAHRERSRTSQMARSTHPHLSQRSIVAFFFFLEEQMLSPRHRSSTYPLITSTLNIS